VGANLSSQVLKPLLAHPRSTGGWSNLHSINPSAFPSGHTTASMSLALAAVLVAPRAWRPLVAAVFGAVAVGVGLALVMLNWHFPSDVVGGQLLATAWGLVAFAALRTVNERWPQEGTVRQAISEKTRLGSAAFGAAVLLALTFAIGVAVSRADALATYAQEHTAAVAVGAGISASAITLLAVVTALAARRN
jgi:hypothetical protein